MNSDDATPALDAVKEFIAEHTTPHTYGVTPSGEEGRFVTDDVRRIVNHILHDIKRASHETALQEQMLNDSLAHLRRAGALLIDPLKARVAELESTLAGWSAVLSESDVDAKGKTWKCPNGSVSFRTVPSRLKITDPALCEASAMAEQEHFVMLVPKLNPVTVERYFKSTGDIPPGCEVSEARESFSYKLSGD